jgi:hypothetical protein
MRPVPSVGRGKEPRLRARATMCQPRLRTGQDCDHVPERTYHSCNATMRCSVSASTLNRPAPLAATRRASTPTAKFNW